METGAAVESPTEEALIRKRLSAVAGIARGLLLYSRRTANGKYGEWLMVCPPLIATEAEIDEIARLLGDTLAAYADEMKREGAIR